MGTFERLYRRIINNPRDVRFEDLDRLLRRYGFQCRQPRKGSSHYNYYHSKVPYILTIPKDRPIKAIYVKQAIEAIEKLKEGGQEK